MIIPVGPCPVAVAAAQLQQIKPSCSCCSALPRTSRRPCADARTTTAARRAGLAAATRVLQAEQKHNMRAQEQHADQVTSQSVEPLLA
jgi:hypothetical protein